MRIGTLPGRNPGTRTWRPSSSSRSASFPESSLAGTTMRNSRLSPSLLVSVTCIKQDPCFEGGREEQADKAAAWCGRGDLNPHDLHRWNLNPVRLPIPPRPPPRPAAAFPAAAGALLAPPRRPAPQLLGRKRPSDQEVFANPQPERARARIAIAAATRPSPR